VAARRFVAAVGEAIGQRGACAVVLSGGRTPQALFRVLAERQYSCRIAWDKVDFFWGDERCVPPTHELSNYGTAHQELLSRVEIQPQQVHRIPGELPAADQVALKYEEDLSRYFGFAPGQGRPRFDLVLLGLGADGHTASLFPCEKALQETTRWAVPVERRDEVSRVTLTLPVLNAARQIHFLAVGDEKARAVYHIVARQGDPSTWPARLVQPDEGRVLWFVDPEAAVLLKNPADPGDRSFS
jgi:6-phosphogluconolactonase